MAAEPKTKSEFRLLESFQASSPAWRVFNDLELSDLADAITVHKVKRGTYIMRNGEQGEFLSLILTGKVEILHKDLHHGVEANLGIAVEGDCFGEISHEVLRCASLCCISGMATVGSISYEALERIYAGEAELGLKVLEVICVSTSSLLFDHLVLAAPRVPLGTRLPLDHTAVHKRLKATQAKKPGLGKAMDEADLGMLAVYMSVHEYQYGDMIYNLGSWADSIMVVLRGRVAVRRMLPQGGFDWGALDEGESFGHFGLGSSRALVSARQDEAVAYTSEAMVGVLPINNLLALHTHGPAERLVWLKLFCRMGQQMLQPAVSAKKPELTARLNQMPPFLQSLVKPEGGSQDGALFTGFKPKGNAAEQLVEEFYLLQRVSPHFFGLSVGDIQVLLPFMQVFDVPDGISIFRKGGQEPVVVLILEGFAVAAERPSSSQVVARRGDWLGAHCLFEAGERRPASALAGSGGCCLAALKYSELARLAVEHPAPGLLVMQSLLRASERKMEVDEAKEVEVQSPQPVELKGLLKAIRTASTLGGPADALQRGVAEKAAAAPKGGPTRASGAGAKGGAGLAKGAGGRLEGFLRHEELSDADMEVLCAHMAMTTYNAGDKAFKLSALADAVVYVLSGSLQLVHNSIVIKEVAPGLVSDGLGPFLTRNAPSHNLDAHAGTTHLAQAHASASGGATVAVLPRCSLQAMSEAHPEVGLRFCVCLANVFTAGLQAQVNELRGSSVAAFNTMQGVSGERHLAILDGEDSRNRLDAELGDNGVFDVEYGIRVKALEAAHPFTDPQHVVRARFESSKKCAATVRMALDDLKGVDAEMASRAEAASAAHTRERERSGSGAPRDDDPPPSTAPRRDTRAGGDAARPGGDVARSRSDVARSAGAARPAEGTSAPSEPADRGEALRVEGKGVEKPALDKSVSGKRLGDTENWGLVPQHEYAKLLEELQEERRRHSLMWDEVTELKNKTGILEEDLRQVRQGEAEALEELEKLAKATEALKTKARQQLNALTDDISTLDTEMGSFMLLLKHRLKKAGIDVTALNTPALVCPLATSSRPSGARSGGLSHGEGSSPDNARLQHMNALLYAAREALVEIDRRHEQEKAEQDQKHAEEIKELRVKAERREAIITAQATGSIAEVACLIEILKARYLPRRGRVAYVGYLPLPSSRGHATLSVPLRLVLGEQDIKPADVLEEPDVKEKLAEYQAKEELKGEARSKDDVALRNLHLDLQRAVKFAGSASERVLAAEEQELSVLQQWDEAAAKLGQQIEDHDRTHKLRLLRFDSAKGVTATVEPQQPILSRLKVVDDSDTSPCKILLQHMRALGALSEEMDIGYDSQVEDMRSLKQQLAVAMQSVLELRDEMQLVVPPLFREVKALQLVSQRRYGGEVHLNVRNALSEEDRKAIEIPEPPAPTGHLPTDNATDLDAAMKASATDPPQIRASHNAHTQRPLMGRAGPPNGLWRWRAPIGCCRRLPASPFCAACFACCPSISDFGGAIQRCCGLRTGASCPGVCEGWRALALLQGGLRSAWRRAPQEQRSHVDRLHTMRYQVEGAWKEIVEGDSRRKESVLAAKTLMKQEIATVDKLIRENPAFDTDPPKLSEQLVKEEFQDEFAEVLIYIKRTKVLSAEVQEARKREAEWEQQSLHLAHLWAQTRNLLFGLVRAGLVGGAVCEGLMTDMRTSHSGEALLRLLAHKVELALEELRAAEGSGLKSVVEHYNNLSSNAMSEGSAQLQAMRNQAILLEELLEADGLSDQASTWQPADDQLEVPGAPYGEAGGAGKDILPTEELYHLQCVLGVARVELMERSKSLVRGSKDEVMPVALERIVAADEKLRELGHHPTWDTPKYRLLNEELKKYLSWRRMKAAGARQTSARHNMGQPRRINSAGGFNYPSARLAMDSVGAAGPYRDDGHPPRPNSAAGPAAARPSSPTTPSSSGLFSNRSTSAIDKDSSRSQAFSLSRSVDGGRSERSSSAAGPSATPGKTIILRSIRPSSGTPGVDLGKPRASSVNGGLKMGVRAASSAGGIFSRPNSAATGSGPMQSRQLRSSSSKTRGP
ncbi:hypothetical protein CYMTET_5297 [Cymbomonas tetramitiformis]|uniref:Cyclic nucleotide-binding domain-containing protein n=1 Tax=Cymbomonas tetramitiformis TaxID=36881 RepID=A0AAE0LJ77_9CHLO|nr:hypothetical protein CYMTET_5297 [Cymbomonas tetramitiformis]